MAKKLSLADWKAKLDKASAAAAAGIKEDRAKQIARSPTLRSEADEEAIDEAIEADGETLAAYVAAGRSGTREGQAEAVKIRREMGRRLGQR